MTRPNLILAAVGLCLAIACGDAETSGQTSGAGGGGGSAPACESSADCTPTTCAADEAATTSCTDGTCQTNCEAGFSACTECMTPAECTFAGDLCPPPRTEPNQNCFEGKCSEFCGGASQQSCLTDGECAQIRCPGSAAAIAQCVGGGCMTAARRCCQ